MDSCTVSVQADTRLKSPHDRVINHILSWKLPHSSLNRVRDFRLAIVIVMEMLHSLSADNTIIPDVINGPRLPQFAQPFMPEAAMVAHSESLQAKSGKHVSVTRDARWRRLLL